MNRDIKFRAWDTAQKQPMMFFGPDFALDDDRDNLTFGPGEGSRVLGDYDSGNRFILMQFTGLLDKNGKEIYEGDVVKWFKVNSLGNTFERIQEAGIRMAYDGIPRYEIEVIGNVWENPELL